MKVRRKVHMGYSEARMIGKTEARMRAMGKQDFFVPPAVGSLRSLSEEMQAM
jgi:hypothetical protein